MAITYIGGNSTQSTAATFTIDQPSGTQIGDLLVVAIEIETGVASLGTPSPDVWTILTGVDQGSNQGVRIYWRFASATGTSTYTFSTGGKKTSAGLLAFRGMDVLNPLQVFSSATGTTGNMVAPTLTNGRANSVLLSFFASKVSTGAHSQPTGMTQRYITTATDFRSSGNTQNIAATGATGTRDAGTSGGDSWTAVSVLVYEELPSTRYYPIATSTSRGVNEPSSEQSTVLPNGSLGPSGAYVDGPDYFQLGTTKQSTTVQNRVRWSSLAQTGTQSTFVAHGWYRLGAQTISSGTWKLGTAVLTSNTAANTFFAASVYVWRPSTSSVVGYIYDNTAQLGNEWRGDSTAESRLIAFAGNSVTAINGDTLIFEIWATATQGAGSSYTNWMFFDAGTGASDFSADGQADLSSWIDSPVTLVPYEIQPEGEPNTIILGSGVPFQISQIQIGSAVRITQ